MPQNSPQNVSNLKFSGGFGLTTEKQLPPPLNSYHVRRAKADKHSADLNFWFIALGVM